MKKLQQHTKREMFQLPCKLSELSHMNEVLSNLKTHPDVDAIFSKGEILITQRKDIPDVVHHENNILRSALSKKLN